MEKIGKCSMELWDKIDNILKEANRNQEPRTGFFTEWIHLRDCVARGVVTPGEAYDAIKLGYVPSFLCVRESRYSHLIRI